MNTTTGDIGQTKQKNEIIILSRCSRLTIYFCILIICFFSQLDLSAINISLIQFKQELSLSDKDYGFFSSLNYIGKILGSFSFMFLLNICNRKFLCCFILLLYTPSFCALILKTNIYIIFGSRILLGYANIFLFTYFPVWCDQYGLKKHKALMITLINCVLPLGSMLGTLLSSYIHWTFPLYIEMSVLGFFSIVFLFVSSNYFSRKLFSVDVSEFDEEDKQKFSYIVTGFREITPLIAETINDVRDDENNNDEVQKKEEVSFKKSKSKPSISLICQTPLFILWVIPRALTFAPNLVLSNFASEYMKKALGIIKQKDVLLIYNLSCLASSFIGSVLGGVVCTLIGGYETKKARVLVFVNYVIYSGLCWIYPTINDSIIFGIVYGCLMFLFNFNNPIMIGIILSSVPEVIRGTASSIHSFLYNMLGQLPAPVVYGLLSEHNPDKPRYAMKMSILFSVVPASLFFVSLIADFIIRGRMQKIKKSEQLKRDLQEKEQGDNTL